MNKVLVSAAFALALIASGNAFAGSDIDESIYAETDTFANHEVTNFVPAPGPISEETAALYEETSSDVVAYEPSVEVSEQLADRGNAANDSYRFVAE